ncbi:Sugar lactone lactonase YvrE [Sphingomonas guangdongensis]|uniref:Sugar lactone lactonase YvrE n=1 Tax=Sphingomonas guangdongensis TaxID=1141890 RepID=A0A285QZS0_9SPHN|nr:SMP-30/gluconolactonase/LRE family protein [Sphingomonas guangdongensis]SOB87395.1 Sugar lactone lactonase YvrE [Sphingomonas guangdongensis]
MVPERVLSVGATLGEGPVWVARDAALWFVDIKQNRVHRFDPATRAAQAWDAPDQVGWVLPTTDGAMIAGLKTGLHRFLPADGSFTPFHDPEPALPDNRLNDATVDARGRLWFGTMDDRETDTTGRLYRLADGRCADAGLDPVVITNGPAVSADARTLYHTDTLGRVIWRVPVNDDGSLGRAERHVTIEDDAGYPDGCVLDADDCLWTGLFGGWGVRRYDPAGRLITTVRLPVANVTKLAFGGPDLGTAFVTTARKGLDAAALAGQPLAGDLFAFDPGVAGVPGGIADISNFEGGVE